VAMRSSIGASGGEAGFAWGGVAGLASAADSPFTAGTGYQLPCEP
jgi:hypothetical protein